MSFLWGRKRAVNKSRSGGRRKGLLGLLAFAAAMAAQSEAHACDGATYHEVKSPDQNITLEFCLQNTAPRYSIRHGSQRVIEWSGLGFDLQNKPDLLDYFKLADVRHRAHHEVWEQVWGEERYILNHYNEMRVVLAETSKNPRRMEVVFRAFNDGVAFRYEVPEQDHLHDFEIKEERSEFNFTADHSAWWIRAFTHDRYERLYKRTKISEIPHVHTPMTIEANGLYVALHEAALTDYTTMTLINRGRGKLESYLVPWKDGPAVKTQAPMATPWRTIQIGRTPGDLVTSYMVLNLNEPNRLSDTSWIKPQKYLGIWWGMHIGKWTWGSGPRHGATTENTKQYIDYAADLKIPAVLVEGWNEGWDGDWMANGAIFNFLKPYPDFDLNWLANYAASRGVQIIGHHETAAVISNYERQVDDAFRMYNNLGMRMVKTGYVGGKVEGGEWHHGQFMVRHHQRITEKAASEKIMLNIHEPIKDTGLRRTYPNVMTREGARGSEYDAWGGGNPPDFTTIVPFTRGLSGPFDYTPGIFDILKGDGSGSRALTTLAKQLAFYVVIYSPLHMAADLPENYNGHPAFKFIQDVPTDWETTRVLDSAIGDHVTTVRKDRNSADWYLGSITDEHAREFEFELSFLESGRDYCAEIYRDRGDAHYRHNPTVYEIVRRTVRRGDSLRMKLAPGGGQAIRFAAAGSCP